MKRDIKGIIGWSVLSLIFGIVMLIPMLAREVYQYIMYLKPNNKGFEWTDVIIYTIWISIFSLFHWCVLDIVFTNCNIILYW